MVFDSSHDSLLKSEVDPVSITSKQQLNTDGINLLDVSINKIYRPRGYLDSFTK